MVKTNFHPCHPRPPHRPLGAAVECAPSAEWCKCLKSCWDGLWEISEGILGYHGWHIHVYVYIYICIYIYMIIYVYTTMGDIESTRWFNFYGCRWKRTSPRENSDWRGCGLKWDVSISSLGVSDNGGFTRNYGQRLRKNHEARGFWGYSILCTTTDWFQGTSTDKPLFHEQYA